MISFYKKLTRNQEIRNTLVRVLPNICRRGNLGKLIFGTNFSNEMLLNASKYQGYSFYRLAVIRGKPTRGGKITRSNPKQMFQRLPIVLAKVKAVKNSQSLLNEIRQIVYSLYQSKEVTKKNTIT